MSVDPYVAELAQAYRDEHERFVSRWILEHQAKDAERAVQVPQRRGSLRMRPGFFQPRHH